MEDMVGFLNALIRRRGISASRLAREIGVSHATVSRWLAGKDLPSPQSCEKLADYGGVRVEWLLSLAHYLPAMETAGATQWPEFREYARLKYPNELDEDVIAMIEDLIERRRRKREAQGG